MLDFSVHTPEGCHEDSSSRTLVQAPKSLLLNTPNFCQKAAFSEEELAAPKIIHYVLPEKLCLLYTTQTLCSFRLCSRCDLSQTQLLHLAFFYTVALWNQAFSSVSLLVCPTLD